MTALIFGFDRLAVQVRLHDFTGGDSCLPADISLGAGRQRYSMLLNSDRVDDIMVANLGFHLLVIVNAATKLQDEAILGARLGNTCWVETLVDHALIAIQRRLAEAVLAPHVSEVVDMKFIDVTAVRVVGPTGIVLRSGYTGRSQV